MTRLRKMMLEELQRGKPPTRHSPCALLSAAPANTGTEGPARYLSPERSLALSKMWWANGIVERLTAAEIQLRSPPLATAAA